MEYFYDVCVQYDTIDDTSRSIEYLGRMSKIISQILLGPKSRSVQSKLSGISKVNLPMGLL